MIRKAKDSDFDVIHNLVNNAYEVESGNQGVAFKSAKRFDFDINSQIMKDEMRNMYVYVDGDTIKGCAKAEILSSGKLLIGPLAVSPMHQNQGICSKLMDYAESLAPLSQMTVHSCRTDIIPMYMKRGYQLVERRPIDKIFKSSVTRDDIEALLFEKNNIT